MGALARMVAGVFADHDPDSSSSTFNRPSAWLVNALTGSSATRSGIRVDTEKAKTIAAVFAAIRNISEDIAKVPLKFYERTERGKAEVMNHPVARVIKVPNADLTAFSFRESLVAATLGWGNGFAEIIRDGADRPRSLELVHPSRVKAERTKAGGLEYQVHMGDVDVKGLTGVAGNIVRVPARDMIHVRGHGDDIMGRSPIMTGAESLGIAIAAQQQAASFFGNGMHPSGAFIHPEALNEVARTNLREYLQKTYGGSSNNGKTLLLWGGLKYERIGIAPQEAQLLESRLFQVQEVARWFRIPLSKLQENTHSTFSNTEQEALAYSVDTLHAWAVRIEQELQRKLILATDTRHFIKHKLQALVRADMRTRGEFYRTRFNMGSLSPDEVRELEDENTIGSPASQATYLQSGMTTINRIFDGDNLTSSQGESEPAEGDDMADDGSDGDDSPVPAGLRPAANNIIERYLTRQHRACADAKKRNLPPFKFSAWAREFFHKEHDMMLAALEPTIDEICTKRGTDPSDAHEIIETYCRRSAERAEPAVSLEQLTDDLIEAICYVRR